MINENSSLTKICSICANEKLLECFAKFISRGKPSIRSYCKDCGNKMSKDYREKDPQKRRDQINKSREANKHKYVEKKKQWHADHADELRTVRQARRAAMTEEQKQRKRKRHNEWLKENPDKADGYRKKRRIRERMGGNTALEEYIEILLKDPCSYCGGVSTTIDHITPLSKGGKHSINNITGACKSCNSAKNDKPLLIFLVQRAHDAAGTNCYI